MGKKASNPSPPTTKEGTSKMKITFETQEGMDYGSTVEDRISGFKGTITAFFVYMYGCVRINVESSKLKDGVPITRIFDEPQLKLVKSKKKVKNDTEEEPKYGHRDDPSNRHDEN